MKNKILLPAAILLSVSMAFPQAAAALQNPSEALDTDLGQVLDEYSVSLEESYYAPENSRSLSTLPFNLTTGMTDGYPHAFSTPRPVTNPQMGLQTGRRVSCGAFPVVPSPVRCPIILGERVVLLGEGRSYRDECGPGRVVA